jgi:putative acetyltransferase
MIRAYRPSDCDAVLNVWASASAVAHSFLSDEFVAAERRNIAEKHLPAAETWVWVAAGRIAGFIAMVGNEIGGLFVDPQLHGRGIGRCLVDHVRKLHDQLEVEVFAENQLGRAFYKAYGFVELREEVHAATGLAVMRLSLPPAEPPETRQR